MALVGSPLPTAKWTKNGTDISPGDVDMETIPRKHNMTIHDAQPGDTGNYELTLTNEVGSVKAPIKVIVLGKWMINKQRLFKQR